MPGLAVRSRLIWTKPHCLKAHHAHSHCWTAGKNVADQTDERWRTIQLHFENFLPHRTNIQLDTRRLRRIGIAAIGRAFTVDLAVGAVRLFSESSPGAET